MSDKTFTDFNGVCHGNKPARQKCPNCGSVSLLYHLDLYECMRCHCVYDAEQLIQSMDCIYTNEFKIGAYHFKIHQISSEIWLECLDGNNHRFQYLNPFYEFERAREEAEDFLRDFSGDLNWVPDGWSFVGRGWRQVDVNVQVSIDWGQPMLIITTKNGNVIRLFGHDATAFYKLLYRLSDIQIFHPTFADGFDKQISQVIEVDLDEF